MGIDTPFYLGDYSRLVARSLIASDPKRIRLRISTALQTGKQTMLHMLTTGPHHNTYWTSGAFTGFQISHRIVAMKIH